MTEITGLADQIDEPKSGNQESQAFAWPQNLTARLSRRFQAFGRVGRLDRLSGDMSLIRFSLVGRFFAVLGRFFGTPLAPWNGRVVPVQVTVMRGRRGVAWERLYHYPGRAPIRVISEKVVTEEGRMMEVVGGSLAVLLSLQARGQSLRFVGRHYQFRIGTWRLPIPLVLTPGVLLAVHRAIDDETFTFGLAFHHPLFGVTHRQVGRFRHCCNEREGAHHEQPL